jgi:hypothetical protein
MERCPFQSIRFCFEVLQVQVGVVCKIQQRGSSRAEYCRSNLEIASDVENADAMGESADEDQVDAGSGNLWRCTEGDAARGFGYRPTCDRRNCFCHVAKSMLLRSTASTP